MSFQKRKFTKKDITPLFEWFQSERDVLQWAGAALSWPLQRREFVELIKLHRGHTPAREVWAVTLDGEMAAHFQISYNRRLNTAGLGRIAMAPDLRGMSLSSDLMELILDQAFSCAWCTASIYWSMPTTGPQSAPTIVRASSLRGRVERRHRSEMRFGTHI